MLEAHESPASICIKEKREVWKLAKWSGFLAENTSVPMTAYMMVMQKRIKKALNMGLRQQ
jgi:hypothetical protein